jgi:hypothetical protein
MGFETIEVRRPHAAIRVEPLVELGQWFGSDAVEATLRVGPDVDETSLPEDPQVLRDRRLADAEPVDQFSDWSLAVAQQVEDLEPPGLAQGLEHRRRRHALSMPDQLYACQGMEHECSHSLDTRMTRTPTGAATVARQAPGRQEEQMRGDAVRTVRWVIVGFGAVAGVVLLTVGSPVIGAILLVMAALRAVMLVALQRRGRAGERSRQLLQRLARNELDVAATTIGIAPDDLRRAVDDGRTIAAVAADAGIPSRQVVAAVVRDAGAKVDRAVAAGNVAPNRARIVRNRLPQWAEHFVRSTPAMLAGVPRRG